MKPCKNNKCQLRHNEDIETINEEIEDTSQACRKQCHLCQNLLPQDDNLGDLMEMNHREYFDDMMEATAEMSSIR